MIISQNTVPTFKGVSTRDLRKYKAWVVLARAKRALDFELRCDKNWKLWRGELRTRVGEVNDTDQVHINEYYANTEANRSGLFFNNPKVYVEPKKEEFILSDGRILNGRKASNLLEGAANYVAYENDFNLHLGRMRDDLQIANFCVGFCGYDADFGVDDEGSEYIKKEQIYIIRQDPKKFLVDPEALDEWRFSDARWVAREVELIFKEVKEDEYYSNTEDLKPDSIAFTEEVRKRGRKIRLIDTIPGELGFSDKDVDAQRVTFIEMWIRPTQREKRKLPIGQPGGEVVVFSMGSKLPHRVDSWPYHIESYPFQGCSLNVDNYNFYGPTDFSFYENQVDEKNKLRTFQLKHAKSYRNQKIILNAEAFENPSDIEKYKNPDENVIVIRGKPSDCAKVEQYGSAPNELFLVDEKVDKDLGRLSGNTDIRRGEAPKGVDSATEFAGLSKNADAKTLSRQKIMGFFTQRLFRIVVQLIKQYWDADKMARRLGTLVPEWVDQFSTKDVQIEDDVSVDLGASLPDNEAVRKQQGLQAAKLLESFLNSDKLEQKLAEEGFKLNTAEAVHLILDLLDFKNTKFVEKLDKKQHLQVLMELAKTQGLIPGITAASGMKRIGGDSNVTTGVPNAANIMGRSRTGAAGVSGRGGL